MGSHSERMDLDVNLSGHSPHRPLDSQVEPLGLLGLVEIGLWLQFPTRSACDWPPAFDSTTRSDVRLTLCSQQRRQMHGHMWSTQSVVARSLTVVMAGGVKQSELRMHRKPFFGWRGIV